MSDYGYYEYGFEQDSVRKTEAERNILYDNYKILENKYQQLKQENEVLRHTIHEWQHDCNSKREKLEKIKEYINEQGIDNKWNMRIQRFRQEILQIIEEGECI